MAQPKGHQPQHSTDHHIQVAPGAKRTSTKTRPNAVVTRGTGMKTKGGTGMKGVHK